MIPSPLRHPSPGRGRCGTRTGSRPAANPPILGGPNPPAPANTGVTEARISLTERLHTAAGDPTQAWPEASATAPVFDWSELRLGPLRFGEPLLKAAALGRPDAFRWTQPGSCELLYARAGFRIDFHRDRFAYLAWFIGPDAAGPDHPHLRYAMPALDDQLALTRDTRAADLHEHLGPPASEDAGPDETVLFYTGGGIVLEFEFDRNGCLKRVNLYPEA